MKKKFSVKRFSAYWKALRMMGSIKRAVKMRLDHLTPEGFRSSDGTLKIHRGTVVRVRAACRLEHVSGGQWKHVCLRDMNTALDPFQRSGEREKPYSVFEEGVVIIGERAVCRIRVIFLPIPKEKQGEKVPAESTTPSVLSLGVV